MARANFVKAARKDIPGTGIKKGDSYYWWKFRFGGKRVSKTAPSRSDLTQSAFYGTLYEIEDRFGGGFATVDELQSEVENAISDLEALRDECQEKLDAMPDNLRDTSSSGELLQSRVDELDTLIDELNGLDFEVEEPDDEDDGSDEKGEEESDEDYDKRMAERDESRLQVAEEEAIERLLDEIGGANWGIG